MSDEAENIKPFKTEFCRINHLNGYGKEHKIGAPVIEVIDVKKSYFLRGCLKIQINSTIG